MEISVCAATISLTGVDGVYTYGPNGEITRIVTNDNGIITIEGLDVGTYKFVLMVSKRRDA